MENPARGPGGIPLFLTCHEGRKDDENKPVVQKIIKCMVFSVYEPIEEKGEISKYKRKILHNQIEA